MHATHAYIRAAGPLWRMEVGRMKAEAAIDRIFTCTSHWIFLWCPGCVPTVMEGWSGK